MSNENTRNDIPPVATLDDRIRTLAATGLKVRDISSLLHVHPEVVRRVLEGHQHA